MAFRRRYTLCERIYRARRKHWKAQRRKAIAERTPSYVDLEAVSKFYANTPEGYVVDHIIPLQGDTISGFHILKNLQYLTADENNKKGNQFPYYPLDFYKSRGLLF